MRYSIIGTGKLATWICNRLRTYELYEVISQSQNKQFVAQYGGTLCPSLKELNTDIDYLFIAVPDDSIQDQFQNLPAGNYVAIHCSGTLPIPLSSSIQQQGNIWPVYSLHQILEENIPIVVSAHSIQNINLWNTLIESLSLHHYELDVARKANAHLIATIGNNFSNAIFSLCYDLSTQFQIPFELFLPLLKHTGNRLSESDPFMMQTGPAIRSDLNTMNQHMMQLSPEQKELYQLLSEYINRKKSKLP
jgi:hypothetical protein